MSDSEGCIKRLEAETGFYADKPVQWSRDCPRPVSISPDRYDSGYGRTSRAIVDRNGDIVLLIDPSDDEYLPACSMEMAAILVGLINA